MEVFTIPPMPTAKLWFHVILKDFFLLFFSLLSLGGKVFFLFFVHKGPWVDDFGVEKGLNFTDVTSSSRNQ